MYKDNQKIVDGAYEEREVTDEEGNTSTVTEWIGVNGFDGVYRSMPYVRTNAAVLKLEGYESIRGDYSNLPAIRGEILKSTPGDPGSYPSTDSGYDVISKWSDDPAGVSFGNGAISQEITITKEDSEQYNLGASVDIQAGGGYKGFAVEFMFGATFSLNPSGGWMLRRENVYEKSNYIYAGTDASAGHDSLRQSDRRNHACCHIS